MIRIPSKLWLRIDLFLAILLINSCHAPVPSDESIITDFRKNEEVFKSYVELFLSHADKPLDRLTIHRIGTQDMVISSLSEDIGIDKNKVLSDMKTVMKVDLIAVSSYSNHEENPIRELHFHRYRSGLVPAGMSKGLAYFFTDSPTGLKNNHNNAVSAENTDLISKSTKEYVRIGDGWYIFQSK